LKKKYRVIELHGPPNPDWVRHHEANNKQRMKARMKELLRLLGGKP
jgi:hypothetical protein